MGLRIYGLLGLALLMVALVSCGGPGRIVPPPDDFTRLTAQVLDANGAPLTGLNVRVEGKDTGLTTGATGEFTLDRDDFPNGINAANEILIGRGGVVIGSRVVVPSDNPDITIRFDNNSGNGTATLNGVAVNEITGAGLTGVQVTLFSVNGGVLQTTSAAGGGFSFTNVAAGSWQLVGFLAGYQPEMAFIGINDGETLNYSLTLSPDGQIRPGEGVVVRGTLTDSKTGAPIAGAFISMMADTGYMGIPEPWLVDDVKGEPGVMPGGGGGSTSPGGRESSMFAPWRYDPQYQETTTAADGSFTFPQEVVGYSLYFNYNAEGYLYGSHYRSLEGASGELAVDLTLEPIVPTDISGVVRNEDGEPVKGAYVEFIFSGGFGGGPEPMPMPPVMDLGGWAADGSDVRGNVGAPPPPMMPGAESGAGWDDVSSDGGVMYPGSGEAPSGSGDSSMDNQLMQKFRFQQQQQRGTSDVNGFDGYLAVTTGEDGTFSFEGVPAGPYYVIASAYRHLPFSTEFSATEEGPNQIEITLEEVPVGSVEGVVTDEHGTPLEDVLVNAIQPNVDPFTYTNSSGHFRIDNVPAGVWIVSGYKQGFLTVSHETEISEGGVSRVNIQLHSYTPPPATLIPFTGRILDGTKFDENGVPTPDSGISGAEIVFTPVDNNYGHYVQHTQSNSTGNYGVGLINNLDYNLLIQAPDYQDLFTRIWVDKQWPMFDYSLWPISGPSWGGGGVMPGRPVDPTTGVTDPAPPPAP